jgi:hypothetical protein
MQDSNQAFDPEEDQPTLLPMNDGFTPPGTPKLLEFPQPHMQAPQSQPTAIGTPKTIEVRAPVEEINSSPDEITRETRIAVSVAPNTSEIKPTKGKRKLSMQSHGSVDELSTNTSDVPFPRRQKRGRPRKELSEVETLNSCEVELRDEAGEDRVDLIKDDPVHGKENEDDTNQLPEETHNNITTVQDELPTITPAKTKRGQQSKTSVQVCIAVEIPANNGLNVDISEAEDKDLPAPEPSRKKRRGRPKKFNEAPEKKSQVMVEIEDDLKGEEEVKSLGDTDNKTESKMAVEIILTKSPSPDIPFDCPEVKPVEEEPKKKQTTSKPKLGAPPSSKISTSYRVGLSRRTRIPSLLKVVRK